MLYGLEEDIKNNYINDLLNILDARMRQYIRYYFQKRIVNLEKTKKADMKTILSPLLAEYDEKSKAKINVTAAMSASTEDIVI